MVTIDRASPTVRGCGTRVAGGVYVVCPMGPNGRPLESFLLDPPVPIDMDALGLAPRGVQLLDRDGATHVLDYVGAQHYPNVADFLEEVRRFGLSRRVPRTLDFSRLGSRSRILIAHGRGWIDGDRWPYYADGPGGWSVPDHYPLVGRHVRPTSWECPKGLPAHDGISARTFDLPMCCGLFWEDIEGGAPAGDSRAVERAMPSFAYTARRRPDGVTPRYRPALVASFPIAWLEIVRDRDGGEHEQTAAAVRRSGLPVRLEDA